MPKTQTQQSGFRRLISWSGRHKLLATLALLGLVSLLYFATSEIVWIKQVHTERERFESTAQDIRDLSETFPPNGTIDAFKKCTYRGNGAVFAIKRLSCEDGVRATYEGLSKLDAINHVQSIQNKLAQRFGMLEQNKKGYDTSDLAVYDFASHSIACLFVATYYDSPPTVPPFSLGVVNSSKTITYVEVDCSGPAKSEYFPVAKD